MQVDRDTDIFAAIVDYSEAYPQRKPDILGEVSYAQVREVLHYHQWSCYLLD